MLREYLRAAAGALRFTEAALRRDRVAERAAALARRLDAPDAPWAEHGALRARLDAQAELSERLAAAQELAALAAAEGDADVLAELLAEARDVAAGAAAAERAALLAARGPLANAGAVLEVRPGAGGADSADWARMLARMYARWAERRGWAVEPASETCLAVDGEAAFGHLSLEAGVHRLVRLSLFDRGGRRHTSFARVEVLPDGLDAADDFREADVAFETSRASGAGGQHVNTTDSAVRAVHRPTGIAAQSQAERSQHRNKRLALAVLRARVAAHRRAQADAERREARGELADNSFGSQVRSYVLHPYQLVSDHRTGHEERDVEAVLDGELDGLVEALLRWEG